MDSKSIRERHTFTGKPIPYIDITKDTTISDMMNIFQSSGYNARSLGRALEIWENMIKDDVLICFTISGALTPVGFGGIFKTLIEKGYIDWIIATGANVYHEDHFAWGLPVKQGHHDVNDMALWEKEIVRIRDVYVKYYETLEEQDRKIQTQFDSDEFRSKPFTTAEFSNFMGKYTKENAPHPDKSFVVSAYENDFPLYISTLKDSSLALNLAVHRIKKKVYSLDFVREIIEQAALVYHFEKSGIIELGGGVPKNAAQQTGPLLDQIFGYTHGGQSGIVQITDARPDTGGLSGATLEEGKSWGKVKDDSFDNIQTVYADTTIVLPLMVWYLVTKVEPRKPKKLYKSLKYYYEQLVNSYFTES